MCVYVCLCMLSDIHNAQVNVCTYIPEVVNRFVTSSSMMA